MKIEVESATVQKTEAEKEKPQGIITYRYPSDLGTREGQKRHTSSLVFGFKKITGKDLSWNNLRGSASSFYGNNGVSLLTNVARIHMYMPQNLRENYSHDYSKSEGNLFIEAVHSLFPDGFGTMPTGDGVKTAVKQVGTGILQELGNNQVITQATGLKTRFSPTTLYNGTNHREQTFLFNLRARNESELQHIGEIIHAFRYYSAPDAASFSDLVGNREFFSEEINNELKGIETPYSVLRIPHVVYVGEFIPNSAKRYVDKFMMGPAVITSVRVDKTPDQQYQTITGTGGDPVHIELEITVREITPMMAKNWAQIRAATTANINKTAAAKM